MRVNVNELKYDEHKSYLRKGDFRGGANIQVRFKLGRLTKNVEYDLAISVVYYVGKKDKKNGLLSTAPSSAAPSTNPRLNKSQGNKLTATNTDNQIKLYNSYNSMINKSSKGRRR